MRHRNCSPPDRASLIILTEWMSPVDTRSFPITRRFDMTRLAHLIVLAAFLALGVGAPVSFANEPAPAEQKEKKDSSGSKADDENKKDDKKGMGGK
jgi:hypothetical protein